jgi:hypothetical protein
MPSRPKISPTSSSTAISQERPNTASPSLPPPDAIKDIPVTAPQRPQTGTSMDPSKVASPAVQQLSALSEKNSGKTMKSRLRRAFSFSSSQELRRATAENNMAAERAKLRKQKFVDDKQAAEDASVAAKQEAAGLGQSIYTHQGDFSASTDNISISSTASSASIMLRKMGKGMKKSTRNLRNLFRPKSMVAESSPSVDTEDRNPAMAEVSLITVEAERERVNVNLDPHDIPGGGSGYPKLERNSMEISERPDSSASNSDAIRSRKSIIGNERDRAEILAAVRKGILKRRSTSHILENASDSIIGGPASASSSPTLAQGETPVGDSSAPATPSDGNIGHEYFAGINPDAHTSTRSLPNPPRNISFNNKVQFFDVWSPSEYDRRGDIATCNRLTPMLAQQIKEELNTFKMVCLNFYGDVRHRLTW